MSNKVENVIFVREYSFLSGVGGIGREFDVTRQRTLLLPASLRIQKRIPGRGANPKVGCQPIIRQNVSKTA